MKTVLTAVIMSIAGLVVAVLSVRADEPPAKGPAELQGWWKLTALESNGAAREPLGGGEPRWQIKGDSILYGGVEFARVAADASTAPRVVDLKLREPERAYEGIYEVEKDTLRICLNKRDGGKDRPGKFDTRDQAEWLLLVFSREKAAPAKPTDGLTGYVGVSLRGHEDKKVAVDFPIKGGPAETAGVKKDDVLRKVGDAAADDLETAVKLMRAAKPGSKLDLHVTRADKDRTITVTVGVLPFHYVAGLE